MWLYSYKHGWAEIEDFLAHLQQHSGVMDLAEVIKAAGYEHTDALSMGNVFCGDVIMEVYVANSPAAHYPYLLQLDVLGGCDLQYVALKTFPDLLELIGKVLPVALASDKIKKDREPE